MRTMLAGGVAVVIACIALPVLALQSPSPAGPREPVAEPVQPQPPEPATDTRPVAPPARKTSPDTITPSERIEADSAVSLPVDI